MKDWLHKTRKVCTVKDWWPILKAKLMGHYQYYGISGNMRLLNRYYWRAIELAMKWLNRRSQKHSFSWESFEAYLKHYPLPTPRIVHKLNTLSSVR